MNSHDLNQKQPIFDRVSDYVEGMGIVKFTAVAAGSALLIGTFINVARYESPSKAPSAPVSGVEQQHPSVKPSPR